MGKHSCFLYSLPGMPAASLWGFSEQLPQGVRAAPQSLRQRASRPPHSQHSHIYCFINLPKWYKVSPVSQALGCRHGPCPHKADSLEGTETEVYSKIYKYRE